MIGVVLLAALLLLTLAVYFALWTKTFASEERKDHRAEDLADAIVSQYPDGDAFDAALQRHVAPHTDKYFYTKVAGASFPNADGSSRPLIIEKCEPMELLRLEIDPNNPLDPNAIAVKRSMDRNSVTSNGEWRVTFIEMPASRGVGPPSLSTLTVIHQPMKLSEQSSF